MNTFTIPTALACCLVLSGCAQMPQKDDLRMLHLVLKDRATYKQRVIWFDRTRYEALIAAGKYILEWRGRHISETREAAPGFSVRQVVEQLRASGEERPSFYFLVRGIGPGEALYSGDPLRDEAGALEIVAGDLLIVDPPPRHLLFGKSPPPR